MVLNPRAIALANLILQMGLTATVLGAAYVAHYRRDIVLHCRIMRIAVALQIVSIPLVMGASLIGLLRSPGGKFFLNMEALAHHTIGLAVVGLWVYVNLVLLGAIKHRGPLTGIMRLAFSLWMVALVMGLHLFVRIWT